MVRELTGLLLQQWGFENSTKPASYTRQQARKVEQQSDIIIPGVLALNVRTGERRMSVDTDQAIADAAQDGELLAGTLYQRPGRPAESAFVVVQLDTLVQLLQNKIPEKVDAIA